MSGYRQDSVQIVGREESRTLTNEYYETDVQIQRHVELKQRR